MCSLEHCSKLENKGIDSVYLGVELLYKHIGTPKGFFTERLPTPRAKRIGRGVSRKLDRMTWHSE